MQVPIHALNSSWAHVKHRAKTVNPKSLMIWEYRANLYNCERYIGSVTHSE